MTAIAAACFAIGYVLVYAAVASGYAPDDSGQYRRIGGYFADRPWQALFSEPPQSPDQAQSPPGAQGPTAADQQPASTAGLA